MLTELSLSCSSVSKSFGKKENAVLALHDVSFSAKSGMITGLLGLNGAGKSTLLNMLAGRTKPDVGSIIFCDGVTVHENDALSLRKNVGFVSENPLLFRTLTVGEVLREETELYGMEKEQARDFILEALNICELSEKINFPAAKLSKGFRQRLNLARAICHNPSVLILDEFSAGLDPSQNIRFRNALKKLSKNKIVIFSTHSIFEAEELCDSLYILSSGSIVSFGSVSCVVKKSGKSNLEEAFMFFTGSQSC